MADNDAGTGYGGGLSVGGTSTLENSIISGDTGAGDQSDINGTITNAFNNVLCCYNSNTYTSPSVTHGSANRYAAADLDPAGLQNNGGPTQTIAEEVGSPSIDAGDPSLLTNPPFAGPPFVDQRGLPRIVNTRMDIGAFQVQSSVYFAAGTDAGLPTTITIYDSSNVAIGSFNPFAGTGFMGGSALALGDVNGDGIPDLIVGSGRGGIGVVLVFDGASVLDHPMNPTLIRSFMPYGPAFTGGVFVAAGNLDGGPVDEIITGADGGGGPRSTSTVPPRSWPTTLPLPATAFYAYPFANGIFFTGGVRVATGDVNGDGKADLITAAGPGGGPQVNVYFGTAGGGFIAGAGQPFPVPSLAFFALGPTLASYTGGIYVTAMDANHDGFADLFCGAGTNSVEATLFSGAGLSRPVPDLYPLTAFFVPAQCELRLRLVSLMTRFTCGVRLGTAVAVGNASPVLLAAPGPGGDQQVSGFHAQAIFDNPGVQPGTTMMNYLPGEELWQRGVRFRDVGSTLFACACVAASENGKRFPDSEVAVGRRADSNRALTYRKEPPCMPSLPPSRRSFLLATGLPFLAGADEGKPVDLSSWAKEPATFAGAAVTGTKATLTSDKWAYLLSKDDHADGELAATFTIQEPAKQFQFFGQSWSAWPDPAWGDGGFEASLLLRAGKASGYRVQLSHKYQELALVKFPEGGYVQSVPCEIKLKQPQRIAVTLSGNQITVKVDGLRKMSYQDDILPLEKGRFGVGVSSGAKVVVENVTFQSLPASPKTAAKDKHVPNFHVRKWLGGRQWVFDGNEPILLLPVEDKHSATYFTRDGRQRQVAARLQAAAELERPLGHRQPARSRRAPPRRPRRRSAAAAST